MGLFLKNTLIFVNFLLFTLNGLSQQASLDEIYREARSIITENPDKAIELASSLLTVHPNHQNDSIPAKGLYLSGIANLYKGNYYIAGDFFNKALLSSYALKNKAFQESCWNNLGIVYDYLQKPDKALEAYQRSLELNIGLNDTLSTMQTLMNMALLDKKTGNPDKAMEKISKALQYFLSVKDTLNIGLIHQNIANIKLENKEYDDAIKYYSKALKCFINSNYPIGKIEVLIGLAQSTQATENYSKALIHILEAKRLNENLGNQLLQGIIFQRLGYNQANLKRYTEAEKAYRDALAIFEKQDLSQYQEETMHMMMNLYARTGDFSHYENMEKKITELQANEEKSQRLHIYNELAEMYEHKEHMRRIEEQGAALRSGKKQLAIAVIIAFALLFMSLFIFILYARMKWYEKFIIRKNLSQLKQIEKSESPAVKLSAEEERMLHLYHQIIQKLEKEKLYLDRNLTLSSMAFELNTNEKYISQAINRNCSTNFIGLINSYRIKEACRLLVKGDKRLRMADLSQKVGFGDPSTFYRQFKDITGLTPAQYATLNEGLYHELPSDQRNARISPAQVNKPFAVNEPVTT